MSDDKNPISQLVNWIKEQPSELADDIAGMSLYPLSQVMLDVPDDYYEGRTEKLIMWLQNIDGKSVHSVAAKAVCVRGYINFLMADRGKSSTWVKARENTMWAIERAKEEGKQDMVEFGEEQLQKLPAREQLWLTSADSWRRLCESSLAEEAIFQWLTTESFKKLSEFRPPRP